MNRVGRRTRFLALSVITVLFAWHLAYAAMQDPVPTIVTPGTVTQFDTPSTVRSFPVYDAQGKLLTNATWRVTGAGGNCCEIYVAALPSGRLITFGGTYPMYSDDLGATWQAVHPLTVLNNGEGAIVAGPNGEIAGIGWDAYSGDHLQSFHYDPVSKEWSVGDIPLKEPFFDRPWITIARGPFQIGGQNHPYIYLVRGGSNIKDPELLSVDGLHYEYLTSPNLDEMSTASRAASIRAAGNDLADYWAPHPWAGTVPLSGGGLLQMTQANDGDFASCAVSQLDEQAAAWHCAQFSPPGIQESSTGRLCCQLRQDSRGWLSDVAANSKSDGLLYYLSPSQGRHWSAPLTLKPPAGGTLEAGNLYSYVVNGELGIAAVSARFDDAQHNGHDMVFVVDVSKAKPELLNTLILGKGDIRTANDVSGIEGDRFDYASVAILPNGAIAASFDDSTTRLAPETAETQAGQLVRDTALSSFGHNQPNLAILMTPQILKRPAVLGGHVHKPTPAPKKVPQHRPLPATGTRDEMPLGLVLLGLAVALSPKIGLRRLAR